MLKENIKTLRKQKGLSQEELSIKLNVVRQTVSKWEQGLSVPDAEMLIAISQVFDTPVSTLIGENITETKDNDLKIISEKLEVINHQLYLNQELKKKRKIKILVIINIIMFIILMLLLFLNSPYLSWNYTDPETAVLGVAIHSFEWLFIRIAPIIFITSIIIIILTKKKSMD